MCVVAAGERAVSGGGGARGAAQGQARRRPAPGPAHQAAGAHGQVPAQNPRC